MKLISMIAVLFISFISPLYAQSNQNTKKEEPRISEIAGDVKNDMTAQAEALEKVSNLTLECEYDSMCIYKKAEELSKNDTNPIYKEFFKHLQSNKESIEFEHKNCSNNEIKEIKKILAKCNIDLQAKVKDNPKMDKKKIEEEAHACYFPKIEKLAEKNNIFAQKMMADFTKNKGDTEKSEEWSKAVEEHKGKPEYEVFQKCNSNKS